ncbi:HAMP domain-containing sensor histidine kinase [Kushneria phosphatilytica]|uniref:histidine kinase n=1 Tax=Kushneria phosphatilytica TaxID=657387 RepID=A0A1S1NZE2_9GAMM|nr:HAMP domain-containing sensor histidine kinase [Kushneria phosphatilytica]OHV13886.1 two-component sensor histidine kinase [Kushneria phosphatilytica]QEL10445.1 HAMP domain-containing histidine kinase [Kushneria phosphatilytica]
MTSRVSRRWRPRSLLQLVIVAFFMVMLPIAVLIFQAGQGLSELSRLSEVSARQSVDITRRARMLSSLATELERSARQYAVVGDVSLLGIYSDKLNRYKILLDEHSQLMPNNPTIDAIRAELGAMGFLAGSPSSTWQVRLNEFDFFSANTDALVEQTRQLVDNRIDVIQARSRDIRQHLWMQTLVLVSLSLLLILFFTWRIIRPIRQLERRILSIGSGDEPDSSELMPGPAELVQLGERLSWLSERLKELEAQKQQFLRHMSHELKTPLSSIREGAGLLADGIVGELTPRQREIVLLLDDSSQELQTLIEQLLDYNLLQHNRRLTITRFDVATVVHEVVSRHRLALEQKGVSWEVQRAPVYWQADRVRTSRILDNLVSNVVAYGEDNGRLWIRVEARNEHLVVEVANTGVPIAENDRPHLFDPFYQGGSQRKGPLKGSGIGLSVAAESARAQEGELALVEDPLEQAEVCFRLTLPWFQVEDKNSAADREGAALSHKG